jgi:hypothetical protein
MYDCMEGDRGLLFEAIVFPLPELTALEKQGFQPKMELAKRKNLGLCFPYYDQTTGLCVFVFE